MATTVSCSINSYSQLQLRLVIMGVYINSKDIIPIHKAPHYSIKQIPSYPRTFCTFMQALVLPLSSRYSPGFPKSCTTPTLLCIIAFATRSKSYNKHPNLKQYSQGHRPESSEHFPTDNEHM